MKTAWIVLVALLPAIGLAMEPTCDGCADNCCQWAYSALLVEMTHPSARTQSIAEYSRDVYEAHGNDPVPCQNLIGDRRAYEECAIRAFFRCRRQRCCKFRYKADWSWSDFVGIGEFPGYDELNARLEKERHDEAFKEHNRRGISGTEPVEFFPGQVIVIKDGVIISDSKNAQQTVRND